MTKPFRETLKKALKKVIRDPSLKKKLEEEALILEYLPGEAFAKEIKEDYEGVVKIVKTTEPQK